MAAGNAIKFLGTGSDDEALALKTYLGHFSAAPRSSTFLWDKGLPGIERAMPGSGKSFQFLMEADVPEPEDFEPGDEVVGQQYAVDEGTITADKYLVAAKLIPQDQMHLSHFQILPRLAKAHKSKLERRYDRRLAITAALAARATTAVTKNGLSVHSGGNRVIRAGSSATSDTAVAAAYAASATGAANFRADLRTLGLAMDIDNIPVENRYAWATPWIRNVLLYDNTAQMFSEDYVDPETNRQQSRKITLVEGFKILGWPNATANGGPMPNENFTAELSKYNANFLPGTSVGTPVLLSLTGDMEGSAAVGVIEFEGIRHVVKYIQERLSWLVMSYMYCGCGVMNPYCAGSIEVSNTGT